MKQGGHMVVGGVVAGGVYLIGCRLLGVKPDWRGLVVCAGGGAVVACIHDALEPALHPNHRAFFHSVTFNGGIGVALKIVWDHPDVPLEGKLLCSVLGAAFLSHPFVDAMTPKGLPLI